MNESPADYRGFFISYFDLMFYYLIYLSDSSNSNSHHIIQNILDNVADWNKELDISGFLVYRDGNFLQLLEGNKNEVLTLFTKIKKDQRHKNVTLILEDESENRIFSDYESGFLVPKNKLVLDKLNNYLFNLKLLENPKINSTISILENILAKMY
ncbi:MULTISPECIES: BLUF domain-containing protein [unclassified Leeuwenhoekiella]|uniref:BLUF domain-containing protein n=2 Tax=Leeuwenhoekiella TaxID=283735 RepID=UPI000C4F75A8|nr:MULTISPECIES: BLUF domain-containing protein [unclassified Leeuwenhoekiella]MAW93951.1 blue light sensor protein [Leeuwenhoekiella sp.]MBA81010.1 blue light sensor protein [Leeuwenhoekiella sp.]|tara:strand:- start:8259 stop:8723 length:465 start_codon:yes stop_codon:yes gene_type:complete